MKIEWAMVSERIWSAYVLGAKIAWVQATLDKSGGVSFAAYREAGGRAIIGKPVPTLAEAKKLVEEAVKG